jgi:site-specific DNA recombinase
MTAQTAGTPATVPTATSATTTAAATAPDTLAVYLRVSSDEQRQQGTIETQRAAAERWLALQNITPYGWYADDGISGTVPFALRPEGARLLADAQAHHVKTVLVWRLDRFGRSNAKIYAALETLEALGVRLVSMTESFDTETPAGKAMLGMLATFAQFERDSIVQRSEEGAQRRISAGGWMGGHAPYGYRAVGVDKDAHLDICETLIDGLALQISEAGIIRLVFHLSADEGWTCQRIADHLNALGVPTAYTRRGQRFKRGEREHPALGIWRS